MLAFPADWREWRAVDFGASVDRDQWRLVGLMHIAETREKAYRDVEFGIEQWFHYFQAVAAFPQMAVGGGKDRKRTRLNSSDANTS